jgi:hypothetical protein
MGPWVVILAGRVKLNSSAQFEDKGMVFSAVSCFSTNSEARDAS